MRVDAIACPNCKANISEKLIKSSTCFCPYCGTQIFFDDGIKRSEHLNIVRDEARLREADVKQYEIEAKREIALRRLQSAEKKDEREARSWRGFILLYIFIFVALFAFFYFMGH